jgi:serine/threonine protein kinase
VICPHCKSAVSGAAGGAESASGRVCPGCSALLPAAPVAIGAGTTIELGDARIVVDARLGEGGMGVVWRGWLFHAPGTPRGGEPPLPVALKVLAARARAKPELRALFLHEADAMRALLHPNVVRFHALVDRGADLAIAMEYVDGDDLDTVIARHVARARLAGNGAALPALPFARAWHYFHQLLGGLAGVHALGFVHRDVKPSNVLVRRDGIVKLSDFGIVQLSSGAGETHDPNVFAPGTAAYMSPEQVVQGPVDGRSDLYSAAIVLFEMLAGRTPFDVDARGEFMVRQDQVETAPPPIRRFLPQAPPVLDALFARALAKDPAERFATAIEMGEAFRSALGLAESPEWHAQAELAFSAKAPNVPSAEPGARAARMATLRDFLVERYRTVKIER